VAVVVLHIVSVVVGIFLVLANTAAIIRALVITRARRTLPATVVDRVVDFIFQGLVHPLHEYERKDQILAGQAAVVLLGQLATWLVAYEIGYALILWPASHSFTVALQEVASSMFTLGFVFTPGSGPVVIDVLAAVTGLVVVALQIAYLPTLYSAFNRRETEVTLLGSRAGTPPWGPELLLRTRYGVAVLSDDLPDLYERWERWAADVAESHSNYPVLVRFRSPHALSSWLVSLLAVMDSAAMLLALSPSRERIEPRRAIRMGFTALREIGSALGMDVNHDPDPEANLALDFQDFAAAVEELRTVGFPMDRDAAEAWPHFRGWRVNYEALAYELALRIDAVPAPWSGPRRWPAKTIAVRRPPNRTPGRPAGGPPIIGVANNKWVPDEPGTAKPPLAGPRPAEPFGGEAPPVGLVPVVEDIEGEHPPAAERTAAKGGAGDQPPGGPTAPVAD
jgi:hypothetical protein